MKQGTGTLGRVGRLNAIWRILRAAGFLLLVGAGASLLVAQDETPLLTPEGAAAAQGLVGDWQWRTTAGRGALREGFANLAATYFRNALSDPQLPSDQVVPLQLDLFTSLLAARQLDEAEAVLETLSEVGEGPNGSRVALRAAWLAYVRGDPGEARARKSAVVASQLPTADRCWNLALEGLLRHAAGDYEEANRLFQEALAAAPSDGLRHHFELMRRRGELLAGNTSEETLAELRMAARSMRGEIGEAEAARLLAVTQARLGRTEEALQTIEQLLQRPGMQTSDRRGEFLLLMGLIAGDETGRGRLALREVVGSEAPSDLKRLALTLLAREPFGGSFREDFLRFLGDQIGAPSVSPVLDLMLAIRAELLVQKRSFDAAEADAKRIIEQFPGSAYFAEAQRLGAYLNWSRPVPRYRTAASYLNTLRGLVNDPTERARLTVLMADCYFLNGDYLNASDAYGSALRPGVAGIDRGAILFQRVLSEIRAGRLSEAQTILDEPREGPPLNSVRRWQAEWNLIDAWRSEGAFDAAFQRLRRLLGTGENQVSTTAALPLELQVRLRWLEARLTHEVGRSAETPALVDGLMATVESLGEDSLSGAERTNILSHALLLKGEALLALGQREEALAVFGDLRTRFVDSGPDMLSYLIEARLAASENSVVEAQSSLITLADRFPESRYAPIALWEAALQVEQRGLDSSFHEAIGILERLLQQYPESSLVYYARLKQADLSRRLNEFGTALALYDRLLALYPDHPDRYRAEMSRADCLFARGSQNADSLVAASVVYERLLLDPGVPLDAQVESGFKWATTLLQRDLASGAKEALFSVKQRFLDDRERAVRLGSQGRYWMARTLLELGSLHEAENTLESLAKARTFYRQLLAAGLPGTQMAQSRLDRLDAG